MTVEQLFSWVFWFMESLSIKQIVSSALLAMVILGIMFYVVDKLRG